MKSQILGGIVSLISLGLTAWMRWTSPEQESKRKEKKLAKMRKELVKLQDEEKRLVAQEWSHDRAARLAIVINRIVWLRKELQRLTSN